MKRRSRKYTVIELTVDLSKITYSELYTLLTDLGGKIVFSGLPSKELKLRVRIPRAKVKELKKALNDSLLSSSQIE